ncbi:DUF4192 domain-containing protein [Amycolatopsis nigrescens]|uniref:DUF4192 domain-containing protein n=1 Tax=Amycolatopsis nigrescens TaxID=381445 RepID=UPI0003756B64|nr:DUF4192 domain-containing protein [Amycolatopsis nigrescens]
MTTATTADGRIPVRLTDPAQLIAAVPYLLGFHPTDSLVLIGHQAPHGRRVGLVQRGDLPAKGHEHELAEWLAGNLIEQGEVGATVVVLGGLPGTPPSTPNTPSTPPATGPPHAALVEAVTGRLKAAGVPLLHAMWTEKVRTGGRWRCYQNQDCGGALPDPAGTVAAAATTAQGSVTFSSREEMRRLLDPGDRDALERRSKLLDDAVCELGERDDPERWATCRAELRDALRRAAQGEVNLSDEQVVRIVLALSESTVRDACLATASPPGSARSRAAERLWLALVRATPAPERAGPASLLGYAAYQRGDGALAGMALENALAADPGHLLSRLLAQAIVRGIAPKTLAGLGNVSAERLDDPG